MEKTERIGAYTRKQYDRLVKKIQKALAEKYGEDRIQEFDVEAYIDSSLNVQENLDIAEQQFHISFRKHSRQEIKQIEHDYNQQAYLKYVEQINQAQQEAIDQIKNQPALDVFDKYYGYLDDYIKAVASKKINALYLCGSPSTGKTFRCITKLNELGYKLGEDFVILRGYATTLELYNLLYENRHKICVCDDLDGLLSKNETVSLLKSATWSIDNHRVVSYYTTSPKRTAPPEFLFEGSLIVCMNKIPEHNENIQALISRGIFQEINFSYQQKLELMYNLANAIDYQIPRGEVVNIVDYLKSITNPTTEAFDLRTLHKAIVLYKDNIHDELKWKEAVSKMLITNEHAQALYNAIQNQSQTKEQVKCFMEETGLSRRMFFYLKKKYQL